MTIEELKAVLAAYAEENHPAWARVYLLVREEGGTLVEVVVTKPVIPAEDCEAR